MPPVQTRVKPKIKQAESSPGSPTPCADCGITTKQLIETYVVATTEDGGEVPTATRKDLCGTCLVGHDVAALRASDNEWSFGEVKEYDQTKLRPFLMSFLLDGSEEWVEISRAPSIDYLNFVGINQLPTPSSPPKMKDQGSIGSFSSSSFSSMSENFMNGRNDNVFPLFDDSKLIRLDHSHSMSSNFMNDGDDHGFPLFDDSKLIHLNHSLSSFDESIFSDDEGNVEVQSKNESIMPSPLRSNQGIMPSPTRSNQNVPDSKKKKKFSRLRTPVMWTPEEDRNLQKVVDSFNEKNLPLKWPDIAELCPRRSGKQCRERFINHLSTTLKSEVWSPEEDAFLFRAFFRFGKKWCHIAKMIPGRTDNGTKNRFHHLKRRLNKDVYRKDQQYSSMMTPSAETVIDGDSADAIEYKTRKVLKVISAESKRKTYTYIKGYVFGPFVRVTDQAKMCKRCGLFIPSAQTGETMCTKTKWCEACTMTPPYVAHDLLRECLDLRDDDSSTSSNSFS